MVDRGNGEIGRLGPDSGFVERGFHGLPFTGSFDVTQSGEDARDQREAGGVVALGGSRHGYIALRTLAHCIVET